MVDNENIVEVDYEDSENKYYTLDDVVRATGLSEAKISFYCAKLNDFLNIQSLGMYQIFSSTDIDNLNRIKNLEVDKGFNIGQIKSYLKENRQEILLKKEEDKIDISFLDFFAKILEVQDKKIDKMININQQLVNAINESNISNAKLLANSNETQEQLKDMVTNVIDNKMDELIVNVREEIRTTYIKKEEIDNMNKKRSWLSKIFK